MCNLDYQILSSVILRAGLFDGQRGLCSGHSSSLSAWGGGLEVVPPP
jgi:hypothetical protein